MLFIIFFVVKERCLQRKGPEWVKKLQIQVSRFTNGNTRFCLLHLNEWWSFPHQPRPMRVKRKQLEDLRSKQMQSNGHSTATGWWSPNPRAASRTASTWRCVAACPALLRSVAAGSRVRFAFQFGIEDLKAMPDQTSCWDGVRNFQVGYQKKSPQVFLTVW